MPLSRSFARLLCLLALLVGTSQMGFATVAVSGASIAPTVGTPFNGQVASFTDDGPQPQSLTATIFWGDGSSSSGTISGSAVSGTHTYSTPAPSGVNLQVQVTDSQGAGATGTSSTTIVVTDAALTGTFNIAQHGTTAYVASQTIATFTYGGTDISGNFLASINWGDGSTADTNTAISGSGPFTVSNNLAHTYAADGQYSITTTITHHVAGGSTVNNVITYSAGILTTSTIATSGSPSPFGSPVTFTATVTAADSSTPSGTVDFFDGATLIGAAGLSSNVAIFASNTLAAGSHSISAAYQGDVTHNPSTSATISQAVTTSNASLITISASQNPVLAGQLVTFTCIVSSGNSSTPNGTVTFYDTDTLLSSVVVGSTSPGSAMASFATGGLAVGAHLIRATYGADTTGLQPTATFNNVEQVVVGSASPTSSSSGSSGCGHGIGGMVLAAVLLAGLRAFSLGSFSRRDRG